ncbi:MAG: hypothetical protein IJW13_05095 [Clostridia bacterium]|nr:hypothetical protein [Clostridia bacterium]
MIEIKQVNNAKERKNFLDFANKMYKGNPCYVPPLYADEKTLFSDKNVYFDTCESCFFNAYKQGEHVGRIQGIIQHASNQKTGQERARFTRFDAIDDQNVAHALFEAVENWAKSKGCEIICGPLGFSDLEREGLLIDGFDQENTFEEQYNHPYYSALIEGEGYAKETDWLEYRLFKPERNEKVKRISKMVMEKHKLRLIQPDNIKTFIKTYKDGIFHVLDEGYKHLYGTVPFTDRMKKQLIDQFMLIIKPDYVGVILNEKDEVVAFGLCFPSIGDALAGGNGKLYPSTLIKLLKTINNPKHLDLALIAVLPQYKNLGFNSIVVDGLIELMIRKDIEYCETNLNLEDNYPIQAQWKYFPHVQHKRRRSYIKKLNEQ